MADALFDNYKEFMLDLLLTGTIKASLIDHGTVTPSPTTHDFWDDISTAEVGTGQTLTTKTVTDGVFDADPVTFTALTGNSAESIVIWHDTGTPATSKLIAFIDQATGLPVTPSGGDVTINWSNGANKIFKIG